MKNLLILLWANLIVLFIILLISVTWCESHNVNWLELNSFNHKTNAKLPNGFHLLFNSCTNEYAIEVNDLEYKNLHDNRLRIERTLWFKDDIWSVVSENKNAEHFKDSLSAKYFAILFYKKQMSEQKDRIADSCRMAFKTLTK